MKPEVKRIENYLKKDLFVQGANGYPLCFGATAISAFVEYNGYKIGFSSFLFSYKDGYGQLNYLIDDLNNIWNKSKPRLTDIRYWEKFKIIYEKEYAPHEEFFKNVYSWGFDKFSDDRVLDLFKKAVWAQTMACGRSHIIEAISANAGDELRTALKGKLGEINVDQYMNILTVPSKPSFLSVEEKELRHVFSRPKSQRLKLLKAHIQKYPWLLSGYRGYQELTVSDLIKRSHSLKNVQDLRQKKLPIPESILSPKVKSLTKLIGFFTIWQDERKRNILKGNSYLGFVAMIIGRRLRIPYEVISQFTPVEVLKLKKLSDINLVKNELTKRKRGVYHLMRGFNDTLVSGKDYIRLRDFEDKIVSKHSSGIIKGFVAQPGIAKGYVRICTNLKYLNKFRKGEILVASMTRPEHVGIMRMARAIITDEGGITSHAAIVSRELGVPCVIGTKIATKVLKDGDLVEVDAERGVVKLLKR